MRTALGLASGVLLLASACIYDPNQRCGINQHASDNSTCACDDGLVLKGQFCVPCGANETWKTGGVCVCNTGYTRSSNGACEKGGPGMACDPTLMPSTCNDPRFLTCRDRGGGVGYCTTTCATTADCPRGYACDTMANPHTCRSSVVGQGDPCMSNADCADKDAAYCEVVILHMCIVSGCSVDSPLSCTEGWACCDVRPLGLNMTLCVPSGTCPTAPPPTMQP